MAAGARAVVWAESAQRALDEVIAYTTHDSQRAAFQILEEALRAATSLNTFAERGRVVPELNDATIREVFVFQYRLLYKVEDERVLVIAFLHGARDFATWRQRQKQG